MESTEPPGPPSAICADVVGPLVPGAMTTEGYISVSMTYTPTRLTLGAGAGPARCMGQVAPLGDCVLHCDRTCMFSGGGADFGTVTIASTAGGFEHQLTYNLEFGYGFEEQRAMAGGEDFRASSSGGSAFSAFEITGVLPSYPRLTAPDVGSDGVLQVSRRGDLVLAWTGGVPGVTVDATLSDDGLVANCSAPSERGTLTIPGRLLSYLTPGTRVGLYVRQRVSGTTTTMPGSATTVPTYAYLAGSVLAAGSNALTDITLE
jgi:hypothetical protein